mgnify:FL=1
MPIQDLKAIIPSYFKDVWYFMPEVLFGMNNDLNQKPDPEATTSLSVYKQFYR